mgnify:CR=1 FL=1
MKTLYVYHMVMNLVIVHAYDLLHRQTQTASTSICSSEPIFTGFIIVQQHFCHDDIFFEVIDASLFVDTRAVYSSG